MLGSDLESDPFSSQCIFDNLVGVSQIQLAETQGIVPAITFPKSFATTDLQLSGFVFVIFNSENSISISYLSAENYQRPSTNLPRHCISM